VFFASFSFKEDPFACFAIFVHVLSVYFLWFAFSALVGHQEEHLAYKKLTD